MSQKIKIIIAGRTYPLTIDENEEVYIRAAAVRIEKMIQSFEKNYDVQSKQDALAMCVLQLASQNEKMTVERKKEIETIETEIQNLSLLIKENKTEKAHLQTNK